jgi:hypothetical protein
LSETSQTSSSSPGGGPSGKAIAAPSGGGGQSYLDWSFQHAEALGESFLYPDVNVSFLEGPSFGVPVGPIIQWFKNLISLFDFLLSGGGTPQLPRQLLDGPHPLYPDLLGVLFGLIPTEASEALPPEISSTPWNPPPLQKIIDNTSDGPGDEDWCIKKCVELVFQRRINKGRGLAGRADQGNPFFRCRNQCMGTNDYPEWRPYFPKNTAPASSSNFQVPKISPWWAVIPFLPSLGRAAAGAFGL